MAVTINEAGQIVHNDHAKRGDTFRKVSFKLVETGFDWTGVTVRINWKKQGADIVAIKWALDLATGTLTRPDLSTVATTQLSIPVAGELVIPMHADYITMEQLGPGTYDYDVEVTHPGLNPIADRDSHFTGWIKVHGDVTTE